MKFKNRQICAKKISTVAASGGRGDLTRRGHEGTLCGDEMSYVLIEVVVIQV